MSCTLTVHVNTVNILTQESFLRHINTILLSLVSVSTRSASNMSGSFARIHPDKFCKVLGSRRENIWTRVELWLSHIHGSRDSPAANNSRWLRSFVSTIVDLSHQLVRRYSLRRCFLCKIEQKNKLHMLFPFTSAEWILERVLFRESRGRVGGFNYPVRGQIWCILRKTHWNVPTTGAHARWANWEETFANKTAPVKGRLTGN